MGCNPFRSRSCTPLETQTQAHLDCESVSTQVLLGATSFMELYNDGIARWQKRRRQSQQHG